MTTLLLGSTENFLRAQNAPAPQPDPLIQMMLTQPPIDVTSSVEAKAAFDPPVIRLGDIATYRISITALKDSVTWPANIPAPQELELKPVAQGEVFGAAGGRLKPLCAFNHRATATAAGIFTVPEFEVQVYGRPVKIPATTLRVLTADSPAPPAAMRLLIEPDAAEVFTGQPVPVRVLMFNTNGSTIQALSQVKLNGDGFLTDNSSVRQSISTVPRDGVNMGVYAYETTLIPLTTGALEISAQGFTAGNQFGGPIVIHGQVTIPGGAPQYMLLHSEPVTLQVKPLPPGGRLPGFTGFIGALRTDAPMLSTNRLQAGTPVRLLVTFRSEGSLARFVPPPPPKPAQWQVSPATAVPATTPGSVQYAYELTPLAAGAITTPRIPFSYFDPARGRYIDLTIPGIAVNVSSNANAAEASVWAQAEELSDAAARRKPVLSPLAATTGRHGSLKPVQTRADALLMLALPLGFFGALAWWDKRRRFLEAHPEIVRRRRALKALHRERNAMRRAADAGDSVEFSRCAIAAVRVACAPHFPAEPRALVGRDVLGLFNESAQTGEIGDALRALFQRSDESRFNNVSTDNRDVLLLRQPLEHALDQLEAKL